MNYITEVYANFITLAFAASATSVGILSTAVIMYIAGEKPPLLKRLTVITSILVILVVFLPSLTTFKELTARI